MISSGPEAECSGDAADGVAALRGAAAGGEALIERQSVEEQAAADVAVGDVVRVAPRLRLQRLQFDAEIRGGGLAVHVALRRRLLTQQLDDALGKRLEEVGREGDRDLRNHSLQSDCGVRRKLQRGGNRGPRLRVLERYKRAQRNMHRRKPLANGA